MQDAYSTTAARVHQRPPTCAALSTREARDLTTLLDSFCRRGRTYQSDDAQERSVTCRQIKANLDHCDQDRPDLAQELPSLPTQ